MGVDRLLSYVVVRSGVAACQEQLVLHPQEAVWLQQGYFQLGAKQPHQLDRYKDSGLANTKTVGLVADEDKGVVMTLKNAKRQRQIKKNGAGIKMTGSFRKVSKAITKELNKVSGEAHYRPDLTNAALTRWYKIWKSQPKYHQAASE